MEQVYFTQHKPSTALLLHLSQSYYNLAIEKTYLYNFEEAASLQRKFEAFILEKLGSQHPLLDKNHKLKLFIKQSQKNYNQDSHVHVQILDSSPNKFRKTPQKVLLVEQKVNNFFKPRTVLKQNEKSMEKHKERQQIDKHPDNKD